MAEDLTQSGSVQEDKIFEPKDEDIAKAFKQLLEDARNEDRTTRDEMMRVWTRLECFWNNILDIFLDPVTSEWRVPDWTMMEDQLPPRLINIYRPFGESIVAALSVTIPNIYFHPDDADLPEDVEMAKACRQISKLLSLHNEAPLILIRALVILFNQGTVFGYNYEHTDTRYGTIKTPKIENKEVTYNEAYCPECGEPLDAAVQLEEQYVCLNCSEYIGEEISVAPEVYPKTESISQIVGFEESAKSRVCQEVYSGMQVKVSAYAKKQEECGYLLLEFVQAVAMLRSIFSDKASSIEARKYDTSWDSFSKIPLNYVGELPDNAANVSCLWLRPWQFWQLGAGDDTRKLVEYFVQMYPKGCYAIFINDEFISAYEESMDEHWTISKNPMGGFIYGKPLGENLATVQEISSELTELQLQTVEHGIPETFADPRTVNFNEYGKGTSKPGALTQARPLPGKGLADSFHTIKTAILSQEVGPFAEQIEQKGQLSVGAFPSIFGGTMSGGSKTADEYRQSRAMALQRIGTVWKIVSSWWAQFQSRATIEYANLIRESQQDEKFTERTGNDTFVNIWIRHTSLTGKIGRVEPESSEQLPQSWAQKRDAVMQFMQMGNEIVTQVLTHPNNAALMKEISGLPELYIPGEEQRNKQVIEFSMLAQGYPVPTNPELDEDELHIEVLKSILIGPRGTDLSEEAMNACMMHLQEHQMNVQLKMLQSMPPAPMVDETKKEVKVEKEETTNA